MTTSDPVLARHLRLLRNQGMERPYEYEIVGTNRRLTDLQAALAIPQLEQLDELIERRVTNASMLTEHLGDHADLGLPRAPRVATTSGTSTRCSCPRTRLATPSSRACVREGWSPVSLPEARMGSQCLPSRSASIVDETPVAADAAARCLSLPVHAGLQAADVERVASCLLEALDEQHARHVA